MSIPLALITQWGPSLFLERLLLAEGERPLFRSVDLSTLLLLEVPLEAG